MGLHAVEAMTSTRDQLRVLDSMAEPAKSEAQVNAMVGVTPMIGLNDVSPEVFTTGDAALLVDEARNADIGFLSFWSATRDQQCPKRQVVSPSCSGIVQSPWAFTGIFERFTVY